MRVTTCAIVSRLRAPPVVAKVGRLTTLEVIGRAHDLATGIEIIGGSHGRTTPRYHIGIESCQTLRAFEIRFETGILDQILRHAQHCEVHPEVKTDMFYLFVQLSNSL